VNHRDFCSVFLLSLHAPCSNALLLFSLFRVTHRNGRYLVCLFDVIVFVFFFLYCLRLMERKSRCGDEQSNGHRNHLENVSLHDFCG
jgi:hypothetical protein